MFEAIEKCWDVTKQFCEDKFLFGCVGECLWGLNFVDLQKIMPVSKFEMRCEAKMTTPAVAFPSINPPTVPTTNAGPDVIEKVTIFCASVSEIKLFE